MGELIICALAGSVPSIVFAVLLLLHVRGERATTLALAEEALRQLGAKDARDAAEAKATQMFQAEALREQRIEFDRLEKQLGKTPHKQDNPTSTLRDEHGQEWEVLAGMD